MGGSFMSLTLFLLIVLCASFELQDPLRQARNAASLGDWRTASLILNKEAKEEEQFCALRLLLAVITGDEPTSLSQSCALLPSLPSLATYSNHSTLWLAASEIDYLIAAHGIGSLLSYMNLLLVNPRQAKSSESTDDSAMDSFVSLFTNSSSSSTFSWQSSLSSLSRAFQKDVIEMHCKLYVFFDELGDPSLASHHHLLFINTATSLFGSHPAQLIGLFPRALLTSPPIFSSQEQLFAHQTRQLQLLQQLEMAIPSIRLDSVAQLNTYYFITGYEQHFTSTPASMMIGYEESTLNLSILRAAQRLWSLIDRAFSSAAHSILPFDRGLNFTHSRLRVGFLSCFFFDHSVSRLINNIILQLNQFNDISVYVIMVTSCTGFRDDSVVHSLQQNLTLPHIRRLGKLDSQLKMSEAVTAVRALELDVMVYPELGMDVTTLHLARHRFAPQQFVYWGHPICQGLDTIDYSISSELFEGWNPHLIRRYAL